MKLHELLFLYSQIENETSQSLKDTAITSFIHYYTSYTVVNSNDLFFKDDHELKMTLLKKDNSSYSFYAGTKEPILNKEDTTPLLEHNMKNFNFKTLEEQSLCQFKAQY